MKANQTNDPAALTATDINQITLNLRTAYMSQKAQESVVRTAGDKLKEYAKRHPELFVEKTLTLANGVCVRRSEKVTTMVNEDLVTPALIDDFLHTASADALSLKVDHKRIKADDVEALALLQQMEYQEIVTPYYSVVVTDKE